MVKYEEQDVFKLVAALDQRWKLDWCDHVERKYIKDVLNKKVPELIVHVQSDTLASGSNSVAPPKKRCKLFRFMGDNSAKELDDNSTLASIQLEKYFTQTNIADDSDPLEYWRQNKETMPELTSLVLDYLAILAASAPIERLFSVARKVFRPDRCRLSGKDLKS